MGRRPDRILKTIREGVDGKDTIKRIGAHWENEKGNGSIQLDTNKLAIDKKTGLAYFDPDGEIELDLKRLILVRPLPGKDEETPLSRMTSAEIGGV